MSDDELRKRIEEEIEDAKEQLGEFKEQAKPVPPDSSIGRLTRMEAIASKSVAESMVRRTQQKIDGLERVLARVGTPEFGVCSNCGASIQPMRILMQPESELCVKCAR